MLQRRLLGLGRGTDSDMSEEGSSAEEADDENDDTEEVPGGQFNRHFRDARNLYTIMHGILRHACT